MHDYHKPSLIEIASSVQKMGLPTIDSMMGNNSSDQTGGKLIIHDMEIEYLFKMKVMNNFIDSPPFRLYDIFNHLIYHSTDYDKQSLAAYKSFDDYRLFEDGYVESLLTLTLKNEGLHVYVGKDTYAQTIDMDVRATQDRFTPRKQHLTKFTENLNGILIEESKPPVILRLLNKLYAPKQSTTEAENTPMSISMVWVYVCFHFLFL